MRCKSSLSSTNSSSRLLKLKIKSSSKLFKMVELKMFNKIKVLLTESIEKTRILMTLRERSKQMLKRDKTICILTTRNVNPLVSRPRRLKPF